MASLSNSGLAHPPRSNPPLRFSSGPPFPCTTPSTETCVVVVSFMIAVPLHLGGAPHGRPLTPATNTSASIRHRLPDFFRGLSGTPVLSDPTARRFRGDRGAHRPGYDRPGAESTDQRARVQVVR